MKATVEVEANTLREAMDKAIEDETVLPDGVYVTDSLDIYDDLYTCEIRKYYNFNQPDEKPVEYISLAERERLEEEQRRCDRNTIIAYICAGIASLLLIVGMVFMFRNDAEESTAQEFLYKNASTDGIVIEKYTREYKGTSFYVTAEYTSITEDGDTVTFTQNYNIPWEDYIQIELGDIVHSQYTHYSSYGSWSYISFEKRE